MSGQRVLKYKKEYIEHGNQFEICHCVSGVKDRVCLIMAYDRAFTLNTQQQLSYLSTVAAIDTRRAEYLAIDQWLFYSESGQFQLIIFFNIQQREWQIVNRWKIKNKPFAKFDLLFGAFQILFHQYQLSCDLIASHVMSRWLVWWMLGKQINSKHTWASIAIRLIAWKKVK